MSYLVTLRTQTLDQWRLNLNSVSAQVGDTSTIYSADGSDSYVHGSDNLVVGAVNDLNNRKVKRSGDNIANLNITDTTSSTTPTTGALKVAGGVGIQGNVNIGGTITVGGQALSFANVQYTTTTGSAKIMVGTTAQRDSAAAGYFRFNSTTVKYEGHDGTAWNNFATEAFVTGGYQPILVSGTSIKTINGLSILGSGNVIAMGAYATQYKYMD